MTVDLALDELTVTHDQSLSAWEEAVRTGDPARFLYLQTFRKHDGRWLLVREALEQLAC